MKKLLIVLSMLMAVPTMANSADEKDAIQTIILSKKNLIVLNGEVNGDNVASVVSTAKKLDNNMGSVKESLSGKKEPLYLFLNTPGGEIQSGLETIESLKGLGRPVHTVTLFAASMGFQFVQSLDKRYILKNGTLMSHRAKGAFQGEFGGMEPSQVANRHSFWAQRIKELDEETVKRTHGKQTMDSYYKQYASELWLTGSKAVEMGYSDEMVKVKCDSSLSGTTQKEAMVLGFRVTYELDNCPINTSPMNVQVGFLTTQNTYMTSKEFISAGGSFGPQCLLSGGDKQKLCALDTSVNPDKLQDVIRAFRHSYEQDLRKVIDLY